MQTPFQGGARAQLLNQIRTLKTFRVGPGRTKVELHELWSDSDNGLAWIVCNTGTWRLPDRLFPWALAVEDRAAELGYGYPWPCRAVFEEGPDGAMEVEILPDGYRPTYR